MTTRSRRQRGENAQDSPESPTTLYERALVLARRDRKGHAKEVLRLLKLAADAGHGMASHALATWYIHGIGVRKNFAKAAALEMRAARHKIPDAIANLAYAFEAGKGVKRDNARALLLYRRAAALGDEEAAYEVGRCIFYGIGAKRNERLGRAWLEKSRAMKIGPKKR